ncbi:MAG: macro domain-containing protein [Porticoccaceae bacterium]|nr:macro domain-containing protein [Porticoccaceae bacterium]
MQTACREIGGCPTGEVRVTSGFNLPAKYIFHAVGPVWRGGHGDEKKLLSSCYSNALALAQQCGVKTIAFPAISCGVYGYPPEQAVPCALATVLDCLPRSPTVKSVIFCCFSDDMAQRYQQVLASLIQH